MKMKTVTATIIIPVYVQIEVEDDSSEENIYKALMIAFKETSKHNPNDPIITNCPECPSLEE